jgi:hypothetical protein
MQNQNYSTLEPATLAGTHIIPCQSATTYQTQKTTLDDVKDYTRGVITEQEFNVLAGAGTGVTCVSGAQGVYTIEPGIDDNDAVTYTSVAYSTDALNITVRHLGGASKTFGITVAGTAITVQLATNGSSVVLSTAKAVSDAVNAHAGASALVTASYEGTGLGQAGVETANALAGGATVTPGEIGSIRFKADGSLGYIKVSAQVWKKFTLESL